MSVFYKTAAGQNAFTTATRVSGPRVDIPIKRDIAALTYTDHYWQTYANYSALALDTAHPDVSTAYLVAESNHSRLEGALMEWDRIYSKIPSTRTDPAGSYSFTFPAFPTGSLGSAKTITAMTPSSQATTSGLVSGPVFASTAHGFTAGQYILLKIVYTISGTSYNYAGNVRIASVNTDDFTVSGIQLFINRGASLTWTFSSGTASALTLGRETPRSIASDSVVVYSYALPGVTSGISTANDFKADEVFAPVDSSGNETSSLTGTTTPTASDYRAMVAAGALIAVESSVEIYMGNILERRTRCVRAQ